MTKFNLREAIAKNKATFFSSLNENISDTAEKFAKHMSKKENRKFTVTPGSVDEKSFDLDVDGLEYEGGSYLIDDKGDIINVSMGNKVYGNINQLEESLTESVKILDRQADLDQAYFNLDVDGKEMGFTYWDYDEKFDEATYEEVMYMIEKQLINVDKYGFPVDPQLTPEQKEEIAQVVLKDLQTNPGWKSNLNINQLEEGDLMKSVGKGLEYEAAEEKIRDYADRLLGAGVDDVEDLANFYLDNPEDLPEPMNYEFFKNNFDDILSLAMTGLDEGKKSYYRDAEADDAEHIKALEKDMKDDKKSSKMKKSELKAKIKEMVLAEMNLDIQDTTSEYDFLAEKTVKEGVWSVLPARIPEFIQAVEELKDEYHAVVGSDDVYDGLDRAISAAEELLMNTAKIREAKEDEEVEDTEIDIDGMEDIDVDTTSEVDPDIKAVQDLLTQAQAAAQALGDEKLTDQIGNTITFFTRTHIVDKGAVAEELNEAKSLLFSFDYDSTDEDNVDYIQGLLKDARVDAIAQPGFEPDEMVVKAKNEVELRKAKKVIQANGFKIYKSVEEGKEMVNESMFPMLKKILK
jgi:hypothetical protein